MGNRQSPDWMYAAVDDILGAFDFEAAAKVVNPGGDPEKAYAVDRLKQLARSALERAVELPDWPVSIVFAGPFVAIADEETSLSLSVKSLTVTAKPDSQRCIRHD